MPTSAKKLTLSTPATSDACVGLKSVITGDTLCDEQKQAALKFILFSRSSYFRCHRAQEKSRPGQAGRWRCSGLRRKIRRSAFRPSSEYRGQTLISGMGELHLEIIVDRMLREYNVQANVGRPQVANRQTIRRKAGKPKASTSSRPADAGSTDIAKSLSASDAQRCA